MARKSKTDQNAEHKKDVMKWTEHMDKVFLDALLEEQQKGNRIDGVFSSTAYANVVQVCNEKLGMEFEKHHLKNRMKTLKTNFSACYDLFKGMSGFSWNLETKMWDAEPEVWRDFLEAKPSARKWMSTPINFFDKMYELWAKDRATGSAAETAKEKKRRWEKEQNSLKCANTIEEQFMFTDEMNADSVSAFDLNSEAATQVETHGANTSKRVKRKTQITELLEKQCEIICDGIKEVAEAIREGNIIAEKGITILENGRPRCYSETEVFDEICNIGVPESLQLDAFLILIKSQANMRAFFGCRPHKRQELLYRLMNLP